MSVCLWCFTAHKEGTKIREKHKRILEKVRQGKLPCELGGCRTYICSRYQSMLAHGLEQFGNCNEVLAMLNRVDHFSDLLMKGEH